MATDNVYICSDLIASGEGAVSPFYLPLTNVHQIPPAVAESIISTALTHRIQVVNNMAAADKRILMTRLHTHRGNAIRLIAQDLGKPSGKRDQVVLVSILAFLLAEVCYIYY